MKKCIFILLFLFLFIPSIFAASYEIIAKDQGSIMYNSDTTVSKSKGKYKFYYEVYEEMGIIRKTKIETLDTGEVIAQNVVYDIMSEPTSPVSVIYAVGRSDTQTYELLTMSPTFVMSSQSTGKYVVVSTSKVIEKKYIAKE